MRKRKPSWPVGGSWSWGKGPHQLGGVALASPLLPALQMLLQPLVPMLSPGQGA